MKEFLATKKGKIITGVVGGLLLVVIVIGILFATGVIGTKKYPSSGDTLVVGDGKDAEKDNSMDFSEFEAEDATPGDVKDKDGKNDKDNSGKKDSDKKDSDSKNPGKGDSDSKDPDKGNNDGKDEEEVDYEKFGGSNWSPLY